MALVPKIDPNKIFASNAPVQDKPAAFDNYEKGMDETRKNNGRPTIKQANYLHQTADQKNLYIHQNGAALPFDASIEYAEKAVTLKDGELKQLVDGAWVETKTKSLPATAITTASTQNQQEINDFGGAKWYAKSGGYDLGATVKLENGDTVQSTIPKNTNNPNVNMVGWILSNRNNSVETIDILKVIKNPINGTIVKALSYKSDMFLRGGGNFAFVAGDLTTPNNVNIFAGDGGNWYRVNWKQPSIYDAGLNGSETDTSLVNTRLQALVDAATESGLSINLKTKAIKFTQLDLPSDLHIYNGTLDATSSTWHLTYGRGAMMFKTTPRNAVGVDYEGQATYASIVETKNIKFVNVKFKAVEKIGFFFKFDGMQFLNCGGEWEIRHLFKFMGGWAGTPLVNDTPSSYNLIEPINGHCKNIVINGGKWKGGYTDHTFSSPFHFVACEDVDINQPNVDAPVGYHIDIYNRNFRVNQANYHNTNPQIIADIVSGLAEPDMLAMYIGQNCYGIDVTGGKWTDFGKKGLYIEVGSKITIDGVVAEMTIPNSDTTFIDIQPNYRDNTNTYWGNCADITIRNVKSKGTKYGINTSPFNSVRSIKELNVFNADIQTYENLQGVVLRGVDTYSLTDVRSKGQLFIGGNNFYGVVKGGSFYNAENYALYIDDLMFGELPKIRDTDFTVATGAVIYNNGGAAKDGKIVGGDIYANDFEGDVISNGPNASNLSVVDFEYKGDRHIIHPYLLTVDAGEKKSFYISDGRYKSGWSCTVNVINADVVGDLAVRANVLNGSIYVMIENKTASNITALPINLALQLFTYASKEYAN